MNAWVMLPLFNEAARIGPLLENILSQSFRVLVIDDGSSDEGPGIARAKNCPILTLGKNCGKGVAIRKGFEYLLQHPSWDLAVLMDSDGQHDPREIQKFIDAHVASDADVVVGNRMGQRGAMQRLRWITNKLTSYWVSALAGQKIPDSQCGFRSLRRRAMERLQLQCERFDLESEMLIQAGDKGFKIVSIPIRSIYADQPSRIRPLRDTALFCRLILKYL